MFLLVLLPGSFRAQDDTRLVHEGLVNAPVDRVWAAFTTTEGLESWMAAHAAIELKIGGKMKTQYDPRGTIDDAKAYDKPWRAKVPVHLLPDSDLIETYCENEKDRPHMK